MYKKQLTIFFPLIISIASYGQNSLEEYFQSIQQYEPDDKNRYGVKNAKAPDALSEFDFMIGECHCTDSITNRDGSYLVYPSIWKAKYMLNGHAIQDNSFNSVNPTTNLRMYDAKDSVWKVTYLQSANGYFTGVWKGGLNKDGDIVLTAEQNGNISKLTFYNISDQGYEWKSERISPDGKATRGWKKDCIKQQ